MRISFFSPILILLIITLIAKISVLFSRIQDEAYYSLYTSSSSQLITSAFAAPKPDNGAQDQNPDNISNTKNQADDSKKGSNTEQALPQNELDPKQQDPNTKALKQKKPKISSRNDTINNFTSSEIKLLKELSKRRDKLEIKDKSLRVREQVLKETEKKIDQKMVDLKLLQGQIENLIKQYNDQGDKKIRSLVKIYETMTPKDAAKILNDLDMSILLKVISNMKEVKVAPIIAAMNPNKARELSIELAQQKQID